MQSKAAFQAKSCNLRRKFNNDDGISQAAQRLGTIPLPANDQEGDARN